MKGLVSKLRKCPVVTVSQVERENLVLNELINYHHGKITKLTFRALALRQSDSGFNSSEVFIPEMSASLFFSQLK